MTLFLNYLIVFFYDAPEHYQIEFQDAASPLGEEIQWFHDGLFLYLVLVGTVVLWMITQIVLYFWFKKRSKTYKFLSLETVLNISSTATLGYILMMIPLPPSNSFYLIWSSIVVLGWITQTVWFLKKHGWTHKYLFHGTVLEKIWPLTLPFLFVTFAFITLAFIFDSFAFITLPLIFDSFLFPPFTFPHLMGDMDNILYSQQAVPGGVIQPLVAEPAVDVPQDPAQQAVPGGVIEPLIAEPAVDVPQDPVQQGVIPYNIQNALLQVAGPPQAVVIPEDQPQAVVIPENLPQSVGILDRNELFTQRVVPREVFEIWIADPVLDMNQDDPEPVITPEIIDLTGDETLIGHVVSNQIGNNPIGYQNPIELVTNHPNHLSQLATHLLQYPSLTHEIINTLTIPPSGLNFESVRVLIVDLGFMELAETNQLRYGLVVSATSEYPGDVTSTAAIIQGRLPYLRLAQMTSLNPDQYGFWSALYRGGEVSYWAPWLPNITPNEFIDTLRGVTPLRFGTRLVLSRFGDYINWKMYIFYGWTPVPGTDQGPSFIRICKLYSTSAERSSEIRLSVVQWIFLPRSII